MEPVASNTILVDQLKKRIGLLVLSGTRYSNCKGTLEASLKNIEDRSVQFFSSPKFDTSADIIIVDVPLSKEIFFHLMDFCDEGRLVVLLISAPSVMASIHKIYELCVGEGRKHLIWRFVEHLSLIFNQVDVQGLQLEKVSHFEFVLVNNEIREILQSENFPLLSDLLNKTQERVGVLTLNQSLLNSLIKRRIDLKSAFEWSREPEDLDYLLKKVGV